MPRIPYYVKFLVLFSLSLKVPNDFELFDKCLKIVTPGFFKKSDVAT